MAGKLYLVATPIGNLEDITYRAVRVLREADVIACEDTRQTRKLLDHYGIAKATVSYHEHNEAVRAVELASRMAAGATVALVSDAGMPLVSDPGYRLGRAAIALGVAVEPVPGASAALAALAASGLPPDSFYFGGFLPSKPGQRAKALEARAEEHATLIFYEAPHRILEALEAVEQTLGPKPVPPRAPLRCVRGSSPWPWRFHSGPIVCASAACPRTRSHRPPPAPAPGDR